MKLFRYDIRELEPSVYKKWYACMAKEKQERIDRFLLEDDKKRSVAGEMLARWAISERCNIPAESIVFKKTENGKPYVKELPVEFNISHSGDLVVCAVDDQPVGIDIERIRPLDLKLAKRICTEEELLYLFGHRPTAGDFAFTTDREVLVRFFEIWTAKEANCKLRGLDISALFAEADPMPVKTDYTFDGDYVICVVTYR